MNEFVLSWAEAACGGPRAAGGKGWNLGRLHRYGFPVPPGGVLAAAAYSGFMGSPPLALLVPGLAEVTPEGATDPEVERRLGALREAIAATPLPESVEEGVRAFLAGSGLDRAPVAVRSSGGAASQ